MQKAWEAALDKDDVGACRTLIAGGVDLHARVLRGDTALHHAAQYCDIAVCRVLIESGAQVNHPGTKESAPLHMASAVGRHDVADLLIASGALLSFVPPKPHRDYLTPFQSLVWARRINDVRRYATKYGEDLAQRTVAGKTLIQLCGDSAEMKTLLRALKIELAVMHAMPDNNAKNDAPVRRTGGFGPL